MKAAAAALRRPALLRDDFVLSSRSMPDLLTSERHSSRVQKGEQFEELTRVYREWAVGPYLGIGVGLDSHVDDVAI